MRATSEKRSWICKQLIFYSTKKKSNLSIWLWFASRILPNTEPIWRIWFPKITFLKISCCSFRFQPKSKSEKWLRVKSSKSQGLRVSYLIARKTLFTSKNKLVALLMNCSKRTFPFSHSIGKSPSTRSWLKSREKDMMTNFIDWKKSNNKFWPKRRTPLPGMKNSSSWILPKRRE